MLVAGEDRQDDVVRHTAENLDGLPIASKPIPDRRRRTQVLQQSAVTERTELAHQHGQVKPRVVDDLIALEAVRLVRGDLVSSTVMGLA